MMFSKAAATALAIAAVLMVTAAFGKGKTMDRITLSKDGHSLVMASSGATFSPRGLNYDRDYKFRLIEDYWDSEWSTVAEDFGEMKKLGANVVRVHLQFERFMLSQTKSNPKTLERLARLVDLAEQNGLYLDLTGLGCYRKSAVPEWYDKLTEKQRWQAQAAFWEAVSSTCAGHPSVFCYDLMNEPVSPAEHMADGAWLGPEFGGYCYVQFVSLDPNGRTRPELARQWLQTMTSAIRQHDKKTLITVGLLDWSLDRPGLTSGFVPDVVAKEVDFLCVHIYPESKKIDDALKTLSGFCVGKPVVIEETFPLHCSAPELGEFLTRSQQQAAGYIGFYWGKTLDQYKQANDPKDAATIGWLELFARQAKAGQQ